MFTSGAKMVVKLILVFSFFCFSTLSNASNCEVMAQMGQDASNLRDAGVPLSAVEKRLRKDVLDPQELAMGLMVVRLVYKTNGTGEQLKKEVLKKCK